MKTEEEIKKAFPRIGDSGMPMYIQGWHDALNWALNKEEEAGLFIRQHERCHLYYQDMCSYSYGDRRIGGGKRMNEYTKAGIDKYVRDGTPPGDFLYAVLCNDLKESFGRADLENRRDMFDIVVYLYSNAPSACWGSPEKVASWIEFKRGEKEQQNP